MKLKKNLMVLGCTCCLLIPSILSGCGKSGTDSGAKESETTAAAEVTETTKTAGTSGEKTTLRVAWWGNTERDKLYYLINDLFMKEYPNVEIVTESPGWNDYWVSMSTAYASGSPCDVVQFQSNQIGEYCSKNVLTSLEDYVKNGTIQLDNWNMNFADTGRYDGKIQMITLGMTAQAMFINETYLTELGMELWPEEEDITWDEFEKYLNEVQKKLPKDTYSSLDIYTNNDLVWVWIRENSDGFGEWINQSGEFAPSEATLEGWYDYSDRLRKSGAFPNVEWNQEWNSKAWEEGALVNRKVLFNFANANQYKVYQNGTQDNIVLRKVPVGNDGVHGDLLITSAFGISEASKQKDLAAAYINFFVNNEEAQKIFNMELGVPGSVAVQEMLAKGADPSDIAATKYLNMISEEAPAFVPKAPGVWAIQDEISSVAEMVANKTMTPSEAAKHIREVANSMIAENVQ